MKRRTRLTRARLRELLHYNKKTGEFRWRKRSRKDVRSDRRYIKIDGNIYCEHQLAWFYVMGQWCKPTIDHRDGDATNNRWNNLRRATRSQNSANRRRPVHNTSGYKGARLCRKSGKWRATIGRNRRTIHLGMFATPQEAHAAYLKAARKLFGEFARAD